MHASDRRVCVTALIEIGIDPAVIDRDERVVFRGPMNLNPVCLLLPPV